MHSRRGAEPGKRHAAEEDGLVRAHRRLDRYPLGTAIGLDLEAWRGALWDEREQPHVEVRVPVALIEHAMVLVHAHHRADRLARPILSSRSRRAINEGAELRRAAASDRRGQGRKRLRAASLADARKRQRGLQEAARLRMILQLAEWVRAKVVELEPFAHSVAHVPVAAVQIIQLLVGNAQRPHFDRILKGLLRCVQHLVHRRRFRGRQLDHGKAIALQATDRLRGPGSMKHPDLLRGRGRDPWKYTRSEVQYCMCQI